MNSIDQSFNIFFQSIQNPSLDFGFYFFTWFFNILPGAVLLIVVSFFLYKYTKEKDFIEFWGAIGLTYAIVWVVKMWFDIARPENGLIEAFGPSFPSLHTALATTFFIFLLRYMRKEKSIFRRYIHVVFCVMSPIMVGLSRLYLGVHWFSDILAGFAIGIISLFIADYIWKKIRTHIFFQD